MQTMTNIYDRFKELPELLHSSTSTNVVSAFTPKSCCFSSISSRTGDCDGNTDARLRNLVDRLLA